MVHMQQVYTAPNMNGAYAVNAPFPTNFRDYPGGVESFDAYHGPINTTYGEVWWTTSKDDLPPEIVKRFDGKVMAIVGIEMDQVRRTPEGDVSVPINVAYNHHHNTAIVGKGSKMVKVSRDDPRVAEAGRKYMSLSDGVWLPLEHAPSKDGLPTSAMFDDGNGGEYRKTFHAYAPPFAQLVESPQTIAGVAMQIDTWNREKMDLTGSPFVSGPVPRSSLAPLVGPDAIYSGLLECPITTRIQKIYHGSPDFNDTHEAQAFECGAQHKQQHCDHFVGTAAECFAAAAKLPGLENATITTQTVRDDKTPAGCAVSAVSNPGVARATMRAVFNTNEASQACCGVSTHSDLFGAVSSLDANLHMKLAVSGGSSNVTITMTGPSTEWFGVGFGATMMGDKPYTIVVEGTGVVSERKLANHAAGMVLPASVTVASNTVSGGSRTVTLTRALKGSTADYYTFSPTALSVPFIAALGSSSAYGPHGSAPHGADTIHLWPTAGDAGGAGGGTVCVCAVPATPFGQGSGVIKYLPTGSTVGFPAGRCPDQPRGDLIAQRNPTCDIRTYVGGQSTCHHGWHLLDADQEIPWQDQPLVYYKKFRVYFKEYNASEHKQITRVDWGIGAGGNHDEYDVPQCPAGTPTENCTHEITGTWTPIANSSSERTWLAALHHHCHAPTCLRVDTYNNATGELICRTEPVYGGTHGYVSDKPAYDEPGYIAIPSCMWGRAEDGLKPPLLMNGLTLRVVATTNNTYGHHGEMALPQAMVYKEKIPSPPFPPSPPSPHCTTNDTVTAQQGMNNIFGKVSKPGASSSGVKFLGNFPSLAQCQSAFQAQGLQVYTYVASSFAKAEWRTGCYASLDGIFAPHADAGVVSGTCVGAPVLAL